ncbi:MAG: hypothetical protein IJZ62_01980, partial [Clostridia bacterium]|nr:hypothetical protein [Clostridia bacterium]
PHVYPTLVTKEIWDKCQEQKAIRAGQFIIYKENNTVYRSLITCGVTNRICPCELKKGVYSYVTCWRKDNTRIYIREEELTKRITPILNRIKLPDCIVMELQQKLKSSKASERKFNSSEIKRLKAEQEKLKEKMDTLFDLRLDGELDRESFDTKRNDIQVKIERIKRRISAHEKADNSFDETILGLLDIATQAGYIFEKSSNVDLKRLLLKFVFENITLTEGEISYKFNFPFNEFVNTTILRKKTTTSYELMQSQANQDLHGNDNENIQSGYMQFSEPKIMRKKQEVALKLSEGDEDNSTEFSYYYIPNIDITISSEKEASALGNYITLEASQEYTGDTSASRLFGLKHPTTGQYLSPADGDIIDLSFEVVNDVDAQTKDYYKKYITDGDSFKTTTSGGKQYLYYAQVVNASKRTYDFYFIPQGADNDGDFVLTKITYGVGDFTKTYYVVIKIVPDYQVRFGDVRAESEDGVVSNKDNPYIVKNLASSGNKYETFTLAGDGGHLSIKHKNGNNTSKELSVSGFTVKMREGDSTEIYNNQTNVASKLSTDLSSTDWASTEITKMVANNLKEYTLTNKTSLTFSNVKEVVFANQYYVINGEDDFGFKYEIYFTLQVTGPAPAVTADLYIKEGEAFDIALQYELLSFDSETNSISSETKIPSATTTSEYKLINLLGIEAYFADAATITAIESALNAGTLNLGGYADLPAINYVSIASNIYVVDEQGNIANVATDDKTKAGFATADGYEWGTFDSTTDTDGTETTTVAYNGVIESRPASANYTMPKLSGDAYGSGNVAQVTIMIPLQYQKTITLTDDATGSETETTDTEIYTLAVNAYVSRGTNIEIQDGNVVRDGVVFDVASHVEVPTTGVKPEFINDTLEVLVVKGQTGKFTMTLTRDGETLKTASVSLSNTGSGAYKTFYISLSEKFGQNVQDGDIVQIISDSNVEKFYYITGEASNESGKEFTIATISKDVIYLENADLLDDDNIADVTKYYIAKTTEQSAGADTPEDKYDDKYEGASYYYRVSRTYQVTAYYYTLEKAYDGSVANVLSTSSSSFELSSWGDAFNCLILDQYGSSSSGTASSDYLRFGLVSDGKSAVGKVKEIKQSGEIVLNEQLKANEYIKIKIELVVSGTDRDGTETEYNADYIYFDLGEDGEFNIAP